jgi:ketosteroid isomerase-like protein
MSIYPTYHNNGRALSVGDQTETPETVMDMPEIVAHYFEADGRNDADAVLSTFADGAVVEDENARHDGKDAIRHWWMAAKQASQYVAEPLDAKGSDDTVHVRARISGTFPGSPITLTHSFTLEDGKIVRLEIR